MSSNTIWRMSSSVKSLISNFQKCSKSASWKLADTKFTLKKGNSTFLNEVSLKYFRNQFPPQCGNCQFSSISMINTNKKYDKSNAESKMVLMALAGIFSIFQTKEDHEESELIMTIKRAVLMIQVSYLEADLQFKGQYALHSTEFGGLFSAKRLALESF